MSNSKTIETLLAERESHVRNGRPEKVSEVNARLRVFGYENKELPSSSEVEAASVAPTVERAVRKRVKKRGE